VDPRTIARLLTVGRLALGTGLTLAPGLAGRLWVGRDGARPAVRVLAVAVGARDVALGAGTLKALAAGEGARSWLQAGAVADAADAVATLRAGDALPAVGRVLVAALATSGAITGAWAQARLEER
jgi:hypothetical protein